MSKKYVVLSACFDPSSKDGVLLKQGDSVCLDESAAERLVTFGRLRLVEADGEASVELAEAPPKKPKNAKGGKSKAASSGLISDEVLADEADGSGDDSTEAEGD